MSIIRQIIIIIIIMCRRHGYPWLSLATSPYHSSPLAGLLGYILCPHIAAVCKFELVVLLLLGHMWGSIGVHHLWARPCFCGLSMSHGYLSMAAFILIYRSHSYRWAAVVPRSNWQSWALSRKNHTFRKSDKYMSIFLLILRCILSFVHRTATYLNISLILCLKYF